jgi:3-isopropylmalate dehydrogenase
MSSSSKPSIVLLPGDGIGPEVVAAAVRILDEVGNFSYEEHLVGGSSIDAHGTALTDEALSACLDADAILLGAVGGRKWDSTDPNAPRPETGLLALREALDLFASLRPVRAFRSLLDASPLRRELIDGTDMLLVRELTSGMYLGDKRREQDWASDDCRYSVEKVERIARLAFEAARTRVTSVDKANVLATGRLWRDVVTRVHADEFPHVELEHQLVDSTAVKLLAEPAHFDVIVTENMFGDILSGEAAVLTGALGMLPSASLGADGPGLFEPSYGSAPDVAGLSVANPLATILSAAMLLRHGLGMETEAAAIEAAVDAALADGLRTPDLGGSAGTAEATRAVLAQL